MTFPHHFCAGCGQEVIVGHHDAFSPDEILIEPVPHEDGYLLLSPNAFTRDGEPSVREYDPEQIAGRLARDENAVFYRYHECAKRVSA